jgi:hypothetical protein
MVSRRVSQTAAALALAFGVSGITHEAEACSPPPEGWFATGGPGEVPANGVVPVYYGCDFDCDTPPDPESLKLVSSSGDEVPGSIVLSGARGDAQRFVAFKPEAGALVAGEAYTPVLADVAYLGPLAVVPAVTWKATLPVSDEIYAIDNVAGDQVCCEVPLDSCGGAPCFHTKVARSAAIRIQWGDGNSVEDAQYAFRILRPNLTNEPAWVLSGSGTGYALADDEVTTCYTLELKRLADDTVLTFDERCVDLPNDIAPGIYATEDSEIQGALSGCDAPPAGYENDWCAAREVNCANAEPNSTYCETYAERCETTGAGGTSAAGGSAGAGGAGATGGSVASGGSGGTSGAGGSVASGGSGGTSGTEGATGGGGGTTASGGHAGTPDETAGESNDGEGERVYTKGCGCEVPSTRAPAGASLLWLVALGWAVRRRRG